MIGDYIIYVGEDKDFSDRWLLKIIHRQTNLPVVLFRPGKKNIKLVKMPVLAVNRLYTSAISRHGKENVKELVKILTHLEEKKIPLINSTLGYSIDTDRNKQFTFFRDRQLPYVQVSKVNSVLNGRESIDFPCVLKTNPSGRNKTLEIIDKKEKLSLIPSIVRKNSVLQPLIKELICYRTEFVDGWCATYLQCICFQKDKLSFRKIHKIIPTPFSKPLREKLIESMRKIGVSVFSIEYFMKGKSFLGIIDFNLTSNYHPSFIKETKNQLKKSWQKLIKTKLLWNFQKK